MSFCYIGCMKNIQLLLIGIFIFAVSCSQGDDYSTRALSADSDSDNWLLHGRTYDESRFSPLKDINDSNVKDLGLAWSFETGTNRGHEATPVVVDGMMFISAPWSVVFALDPITGKEIWSFDPQADKAWARNACCDVVNRGVAVWGDQVIFATIDGRLISLNKYSGKVNWDILTIDKSKPYTITGAPRIIDGKIIIGNGGAEYGVRGYISAYAVTDGSLLWRFFTVPGNPAEPFESQALADAAETWSGGKWWEVGGGGTVWDSMAYDPELNLLYIGTGNGSPWNRYERSPGGGDNLYLSSIVAINPDNGEYVWHYQTTPGDSWDYTATQHMILADIEIEGELRQVLMQAPKNGFFYVIDRVTGEFISANNYVPMNWASHVDPETGRPVELAGGNHELQPALTTPGPLGGHNWHPMSYNPSTGLVYIPAQETLFVYSTDTNFEYNPKTWNTAQQMEMTYLPKDPNELAMVDSATLGYLLAWDPKTQKEVWRAQYKRPWSGGVLSTDGNLVFQGTSDGRFIAYAADSGELLWSMDTGQGIVAPPISYKVDEEQFIGVQVGYGGAYALMGGLEAANKNPERNGRMMVFKLGGEELEKPVATIAQLNPTLVELNPDSLTIAKGEYEFHEHCQFCHGTGAIGGGVLPDLRMLDTEGNAAFLGSVLGGVHGSGMASFKDVLTLEQGMQIHEYIKSQAILTGVATAAEQ